MADSTLVYFATCAKGLEQALAAELRSPHIAAQDIEPGASGVHFKGSRDTGYRANLWLRTAVRVLEEHARASVHSPEDLYAWARTLPWTSLLRLEQTFSVEARVWDSELTHSKYAALRVKDALCDSFRDLKGARPDVNPEAADLPLFLYLYRNEAVLYRDLSGITLHKRGYRDAMHKSSLNECIAAGVLTLAGYTGSAILCDPMCGAGTFAIEAALLATQRAPGLLRASFPFERWPDFETQAWADCREEARAAALPTPIAPILANDIHPGALELAKKDAATAGVAEFITFNLGDAVHYAPHQKPDLVTVNPPWGERLADANLAVVWNGLGTFLRMRCQGAKAWIFTGNLDAPRHTGLKPVKRLPLRHGKLDCRILMYEIPERR